MSRVSQTPDTTKSDPSKSDKTDWIDENLLASNVAPLAVEDALKKAASAAVNGIIARMRQGEGLTVSATWTPAGKGGEFRVVVG